MALHDTQHMRACVREMLSPKPHSIKKSEGFGQTRVPKTKKERVLIMTRRNPHYHKLRKLHEGVRYWQHKVHKPKM